MTNIFPLLSQRLQAGTLTLQSDLISYDKIKRLKYSSLIFENYSENYKNQSEYEDIPIIKNKNEIWNYVYAQEVLVCRGDNKDRNIYIIVTCDCEWEEEHGLQLVFKNGKELTRVSMIDYAPTE